MNREEVERMLGRFASTFPNKLSIEQRKVAAKDFPRFRLQTVALAIEEHARRFVWPDYPELLKACEEAERETDLHSRASMPDQSFADIARGQSPHLARVESDVEVILRKWRNLWHHPKCPRTPAYRSSFGTACRHQLYDALTAAAAVDRERELTTAEAAELASQADAWADTIFQHPDNFRREVERLREDVAVPAGAFEPALD